MGEANFYYFTCLNAIEKINMPRQIRQRRTSSSDEEEESKATSTDQQPSSSTSASTAAAAAAGPDLESILRDTKELQKLRQRPHGVTAAALALGDVKKVAANKLKELVDDDPWKVGGLIEMNAAKDRNRDRTAENEKDMVNMGSTFAAETGQRDEDAEMCKYIEEEMQKRKKKKEDDGAEGEQDPLELDPVFQALPEHLKMSYRKQGEEMLSSQMLSGIPEVDLGIGEKIRNIEETEKAKKTLLDQKMAERRQNMTTSLAPTNMAVNFVQHNRFNMEDNKPKRDAKPKEEEKLQPMVVGMTEKNPALASANPGHAGKKHKPDSASDDYHFDKFKKAMRR